MADWSPSTYLRFENERTRAAIDLLAQVALESARRIVDVGCGPGNSTELLALRYPDADILGLDNSPAMLVAARERLPALRFESADAAVWTPEPESTSCSRTPPTSGSRATSSSCRGCWRRFGPAPCWRCRCPTISPSRRTG